MGKMAVTAGSAVDAPVESDAPTITQPRNGLHKHVLIRRLFNPLRVEPRREALEPRVCLRHYPRLTGGIPARGFMAPCTLSQRL